MPSALRSRPVAFAAFAVVFAIALCVTGLVVGSPRLESAGEVGGVPRGDYLPVHGWLSPRDGNTLLAGGIATLVALAWSGVTRRRPLRLGAPVLGLAGATAVALGVVAGSPPGNATFTVYFLRSAGDDLGDRGPFSGTDLPDFRFLSPYDGNTFVSAGLVFLLAAAVLVVRARPRRLRRGSPRPTR